MIANNVFVAQNKMNMQIFMVFGNIPLFEIVTCPGRLEVFHQQYRRSLCGRKFYASLPRRASFRGVQ